jgi:hypothetical protein
VQTAAFEIDGDVIRALYVVRNPEKLRHLAAAPHESGPRMSERVWIQELAALRLDDELHADDHGRWRISEGAGQSTTCDPAEMARAPFIPSGRGVLLDLAI